MIYSPGKTLKNSLIGLALFILVIGCSDDPEPEVVPLAGQWQLKEVLIDPGNGSGEFQEVDSDKIIEFFSNGKVESNGNLCNGGITTSRPSSGIYKVPDSILEIENCQQDVLKTRFRVQDRNLILSYPCIEPCEEKYVKLN